MADAEASDRPPPRRRRRLWRWLGLSLLVLILAPTLFVAFLFGKVWLGQPSLDGDRVVQGITAPATIDRDALGIVHIKAQSEPDAYYALGYAHAQDRFFQMDVLRRIGQGRLSELAGASMVRLDARMRRFGIARLAPGDFEILPDEVKAIYQAYADGVNAWLETRAGIAADEFTLLLAGEPERWLPEHSLYWNRIMSLRLTTNWASELIRLRLSQILSAEQLADLWPGYPENGVTSLPEISKSALSEARAMARLADRNDGSNGWLVAGKLSKSGAPLLANDPHLGLTAPSVWHLARLEAPGLLLAGATAPGVPAMILGHNGKSAWGLTNAATDTSDVYIETVDPENPDQYLTPEGPQPFEVSKEIIQVRFGDDVEIDIRATRHGPVISDGRDIAPEDAVLALKHTGLQPNERSAETLYRINRASAWPDVLEAMRLTQGPQQNGLYAGPDGIAMGIAGQLPIRRDHDGYVPIDGANPAGDWVELADAAAMPWALQPNRGWIANANNRIAPPDYPIYLGQEWGYPKRAEQIEKALDKKGPFDLDDMARIQMDNTSPIARDLGALMLETLDKADLSPGTAALADQVGLWNGVATMDSAEPLIFFAWLRAATIEIFSDEMHDAFGGWFSIRPQPLAHVLKNRQVWCDNVRTTDRDETCAQTLAEAFEVAHEWLKLNYGADSEDWSWGEAHQARFRHLPFGYVPVLKNAFDVRLPSPGAIESINRAAFRVSNIDDPFGQAHGPTLRALYDLADLDDARFMIAPGQSGRLFSDNRSSMARLWRDGEYAKLAPLETPTHRLTLTPAKSQ